jgi:hypothetical protein
MPQRATTTQRAARCSCSEKASSGSSSNNQEPQPGQCVIIRYTADQLYAAAWDCKKMPTLNNAEPARLTTAVAVDLTSAALDIHAVWGHLRCSMRSSRHQCGKTGTAHTDARVSSSRCRTQNGGIQSPHQYYFSSLPFVIRILLHCNAQRAPPQWWWQWWTWTSHLFGTLYLPGGYVV